MLRQRIYRSIFLMQKKEYLSSDLNTLNELGHYSRLAKLKNSEYIAFLNNQKVRGLSASSLDWWRMIFQLKYFSE
jgi:hypothetical protein